MTTKVERIFCDDLSRENEVYFIEKPTDPKIRCCGVSFLTRLENWSEPLSSATERVQGNVHDFISRNPQVFAGKRLYFFCAMGPINMALRLARKKRLWIDSELSGPTVALGKSPEMEVNFEHGIGFVGTLELPMNAAFVDIERQMLGTRGFYFFSATDCLREEAPIELYEATLAKGRFHWAEMLEWFCRRDEILVRGYGGHGERDVCIYLFGSQSFAKEI